jgi:hypothetical protein
MVTSARRATAVVRLLAGLILLLASCAAEPNRVPSAPFDD